MKYEIINRNERQLGAKREPIPLDPELGQALESLEAHQSLYLPNVEGITLDSFSQKMRKLINAQFPQAFSIFCHKDKTGLYITPKE